MRPLPLLIVILALVIGAGWWWTTQPEAPDTPPLRVAQAELPAPQAPTLAAPSPAPVSPEAAEAEAAVQGALAAMDRNNAAPAAAAETVTPQAAPGSAAELASGLESLLTPQGIDAAQADALIAQSPLSAAQKATLARLIETSAGNPELLRAALRQIPAVMP